MALDTISPARAWTTITANAVTQARQLAGFIAQLNAGDVTLETVLGMYRIIYNSRNQLEDLKLTGNLNSYVQTLKADGSYDAVAEITAFTTLQQACLDWIDTNAAGLNLTGDSAANWLVSGSVASNRFTKPQTAQLRTNMQAVVDYVSM